MKTLDCPVCMDVGFVLIRKENFEFKYRCTCRRGEYHAFDGRQCEHKSPFYCPSLDNLPSGTKEEIVRDNINRYGITRSSGGWEVESDRLTEYEMLDLRKLLKNMIGGTFYDKTFSNADPR